MKTILQKMMDKRGVKLRTWARAKKLKTSDEAILYKLSVGKIKGVRGRARELKALLEKEGFRVA